MVELPHVMARDACEVKPTEMGGSEAAMLSFSRLGPAVLETPRSCHFQAPLSSLIRKKQGFLVHPLYTAGST